MIKSKVFLNHQLAVKYMNDNYINKSDVVFFNFLFDGNWLLIWESKELG